MNIEKMLLGGDRALEFFGLNQLDSSKLIKTNEEIRRDFAVGLLSQEQALKLLGYGDLEELQRLDEIEATTGILPGSKMCAEPLAEQIKEIPWFWSEGESIPIEGEIYAINHETDSTLAIGFDSEEQAESAFLLQCPLEGYEGIESVGELMRDRTDSSRLDANKVIKGNLCRGGGGRFVACGASSSTKSTVVNKVTSKTNIAQLKAIADKLGIEKPKNAHKRQSWKDAIAADEKGAEYFNKSTKKPADKTPKAKVKKKETIDESIKEMQLMSTSPNSRTKAAFASQVGGGLDRMEILKNSVSKEKWSTSLNSIDDLDDALSKLAYDKDPNKLKNKAEKNNFEIEDLDKISRYNKASLDFAKESFDKLSSASKDEYGKRFFDDNSESGVDDHKYNSFSKRSEAHKAIAIELKKRVQKLILDKKLETLLEEEELDFSRSDSLNH